jgi:hypothetical protein
VGEVLEDLELRDAESLIAHEGDRSSGSVGTVRGV